jgi:hypothetical protein
MLEWVDDEVVPHPGDELELTERIGRDVGEDGHNGGGGHVRLELAEDMGRRCETLVGRIDGRWKARTGGGSSDCARR